MLGYESMQRFDKSLRIPHLSIKPWWDNINWMITDDLHVQVMRRAREVLIATKYIASHAIKSQ